MVTSRNPSDPQGASSDLASSTAPGIVLAPLSDGHVPLLLKLMTHERNRVLLSPDLLSEPTAARFIRALGSQQWALPRAWSKDGTWSGVCYAADVDLRNLNTRLVTICQDPTVSADCLMRYLQELFWHYPYHRAYATVPVTDTELCGLHERLGFVREGVLRDQFVRGDKLEDARMYGILRRELHAQLADGNA